LVKKVVIKLYIGEMDR